MLAAAAATAAAWEFLTWAQRAMASGYPPHSCTPKQSSLGCRFSSAHSLGWPYGSIANESRLHGRWTRTAGGRGGMHAQVKAWGPGSGCFNAAHLQQVCG